MGWKKEQKEFEGRGWGFLNNLRRDIKKNNWRWVEKMKALRDSIDNQRVVESDVAYTQAKGKLVKFMSANTRYNQEHNENLLDGYHFETVNRWINIKPQPEMVVEEVKSLDNRFQEIIDSYLKSNPAKIKELQIQLNDWINYWMVVEDENSPTGRYTIHPINVSILKRILGWTGMELKDNWEDTKRRYTIREDWLLWPQTFAVLCCFKKEYRKTSTRNTNRRPQQRQ